LPIHSQRAEAPRAGGATGTGSHHLPGEDTSRAALREHASATDERRMATILFADFVGSTALGERFDAEDVHDQITYAQSALDGIVERYGGYVAKHLGDGIMAIFGAPVAHEDDPDRAVLAGLDMLGALTDIRRRHFAGVPALQLRIGISSGEVIAGPVAGTYDVLGDAANTASRLEGAAHDNCVLVDAPTMRLAQRSIRFSEPQNLQLRGKAGTVIAYPVLGRRDQVVERWEVAERRAALIGRDGELARLLDLWGRAKEGRGQLVTLVGEAGVGKSRLVLEAVERMQAQEDVPVVRGRCLSYTQQTSLWLIADVLHNLFRVTPEDDPETVRARVTDAVHDLLREEDDATRTAAIDVFGGVLGLEPGDSPVAGAEPQVRRRVLVRSLWLLLALTRHLARVLVLEDLHWIDPASEEVLGELLAGIPGLRLLVIAAQRPGVALPWSEWEWPERITVRPLHESDAAALVKDVLGAGMLAPELRRYVIDRTGGNPFFIEELLRAAREGGALIQVNGHAELAPGAAERLPSTLTEILMARLDRLEAEIRGVAQVASVIGRHFAVRLLAEVAGQDMATLDERLLRLQQAEIVFPRRALDLEYAFKHVLLREVAYSTLTRKSRRALHAATAKALASLYPADTNVDLIAFHYSKTEEHMDAAEALQAAGDKATRMGAPQQALALYDDARQRLDMGDAPPGALASVDGKRGQALWTLGRFDAALDVLESAAAAYKTANNVAGEAGVLAMIGQVYADRGTPEEGISRLDRDGDRARLEEALAGPPVRSPRDFAALRTTHLRLRFGEAPHRPSDSQTNIPGQDALLALEGVPAGERDKQWHREKARVHMNRGYAFRFGGWGQDVQVELDQAIAQAREVQDPELLRRAYGYAAGANLLSARFEDAGHYFEDAREQNRLLGNKGWAGFCTAALGVVAYHLGRDWEVARKYLEEAVEVTQGTNAVFSSYPPRWLGQLNLAQGRWEEASDYLNEALRTEPLAHILPGLRPVVTLIAEMHLLQGNPQAAVAKLESALPDTAPDRAGIAAYYAWSLVEAAPPQRKVDLPNALSLVDEAIQGNETNPLVLVDALRIKGVVLARGGDTASAEGALEEAWRRADAMNDRYARARVQLERGKLLKRMRRRTEATKELNQARNVFQALGATPYIKLTDEALE
jgi:class 3 adenylate cyclase/tetratricopeptide (TPR) repeat protein